MGVSRLIVDALPQPTTIRRLPLIESLPNRAVLRQVRTRNSSRDVIREYARFIDLSNDLHRNAIIFSLHVIETCLD